MQTPLIPTKEDDEKLYACKAFYMSMTELVQELKSFVIYVISV